MSQQQQQQQAKTIATANEALTCKASISSLKYTNLPLCEAMCQKVTGRSEFPRRSPLMHRGYFARVESFDIVIGSFLRATATDQEVAVAARQVLFIGSGYDTTSLSLCQDVQRVKCFEVDFPEVVEKKAGIIANNEIFCRSNTRDKSKNSPDLAAPVSYVSAQGGKYSAVISAVSEDTESAIANISERKEVSTLSIEDCSAFSWDRKGSTTYHSEELNLSLIGRDVADTQGIIEDLLLAGLDPTAPTLVVTECVLVYIEQQYVKQLCSALATLLHNAEAAWVTYDMVSPNDAFGKTMSRNLTAAGYHIPGFVQYPDLISHERRFTNCADDESKLTSEYSNSNNNNNNNNGSWTTARSCTMLKFYNEIISPQDRLRVSKLERFDEYEEWNMLMSHYCITIATNTAHKIADTTTVSSASSSRSSDGCDNGKQNYSNKNYNHGDGSSIFTLPKCVDDNREKRQDDSSRLLHRLLNIIPVTSVSKL